MINVLLSNARMVVARQKKAGKGSVTKRLFAVSLPQNQQVDFTEAVRLLKERLRKLNIRDKTVHLILGEQIIFKEFSHKPVSPKAVSGFARIEARTVLRENADAYSIGCMTYDGYVNEGGEQTTMLLAAPMLTLKTAVAAFAGSGLSLIHI